MWDVLYEWVFDELYGTFTVTRGCFLGWFNIQCCVICFAKKWEVMVGYVVRIFHVDFYDSLYLRYLYQLLTLSDNLYILKLQYDLK